MKIKSLKRFLKNHFLPPYASSSIDEVFGFEVYGDDSEKLWFRCTIGFYYEHVLKNIDTVYYWVKNRFFTRYHVVHTGMQPGYRDADEVIFRACFAVLGKFVEKELSPVDLNDDYPLSTLDEVDTDSENHYRGYYIQSSTDRNAIDLWIWYKYVLPKLEEEQNDDWANFAKTYGHHHIEDLKDTKLRELIDIRTTLWT